MAADPDVDQTLQHIRAMTERLRDRLASLPEAAWDAPTNCPPWVVRDLVAHVIGGGESFRVSVERGVAGLTEPSATNDERERRMKELSAASPAGQIAALERVTADFETLYNRLTADQLEAICYHRRGNRSARWYAKHRLAEVAFHNWDVQRSLGREAVLDDAVAAFLLPTLLESNLPRIYAGAPRGSGRFRLVVDGQPVLSWVLAAGGDRLVVERGTAEADVTITGSAAMLALLVYGRASLTEEERRGALRVEGDRSLAEQFQTIFPKP